MASHNRTRQNTNFIAFGQGISLLNMYYRTMLQLFKLQVALQFGRNRLHKSSDGNFSRLDGGKIKQQRGKFDANIERKLPITHISYLTSFLALSKSTK